MSQFLNTFATAASEWARRVLPNSARRAFGYGFVLSFTVALLLTIVPPLTVGLCDRFAGTPYDGYWELGSNLVRGHGYVFEPGGRPVLHRPPLVPLLFSPLTLLPRPLQQPGLILLHSLMVGGVCWLLFDLAQRTGGHELARVSVVILLGYPWLYVHVKNPMNATSQLLFTLVVLYLIAREVQQTPGTQQNASNRYWYARAGLLGLAVAGAILTHATMLISSVLLLAGVMVIGVFRRQGHLVAVPLAAGCVALLLLVPWTWRNWTVTHQFVPVVSNAGFAYYWGNAYWEADNIERGEVYALRAAGIDRPAKEVIAYSGVMDPELNRALDRQMIDDIRRDPVRFAKKLLLNAAEYYIPSTFDLVRPPYTLSRTSTFALVNRTTRSVGHALLLGLALVGVWRNRKHEDRIVLLALLAPIAALACPYFPFLVGTGHSQYVVHTVPLLAIVAASALVGLSSPSRAIRSQPFTPHVARSRTSLHASLDGGRRSRVG